MQSASSHQTNGSRWETSGDVQRIAWPSTLRKERVGVAHASSVDTWTSHAVRCTNWRQFWNLSSSSSISRAKTSRRSVPLGTVVPGWYTCCCGGWLTVEATSYNVASYNDCHSHSIVAGGLELTS